MYGEGRSLADRQARSGSKGLHFDNEAHNKVPSSSGTSRNERHPRRGDRDRAGGRTTDTVVESGSSSVDAITVDANDAQRRCTM
mmetsp:Transcript_5504/g.7679  ORF Transcript_5504/g.7679 Transcript_5504/m.7679 type:complete len:84 (+) Transcript_5504:81-332(+)